MFSVIDPVVSVRRGCMNSVVIYSYEYQFMAQFMAQRGLAFETNMCATHATYNCRHGINIYSLDHVLSSIEKLRPMSTRNHDAFE